MEPLGNLLYEEGGMVAGMMARRRTLGKFALLPDALICKILPHLSHVDLYNFAQTSSAGRAFAIDEDLWRRICIRRFGDFCLSRFTVSWRATYAVLSRASKATDAKEDRERNANSDPLLNAVVHVAQANAPTLRKVYSDVLFHKWRCLYAPIQLSWLLHDNCARVHAPSVTRQQFRTHYEAPGIPVVITNAIDKWPARRWDLRSIVDKYGDIRFDSGGLSVTFKDFLIYSLKVSAAEDQALLLFDPAFLDKAPEMGSEFEIPHYFRDDLFNYLPKQHRPHHRWLIAGPARSGSTFHTDPNCTSAWNSVLIGKKKWILFPPHITPPGILTTTDGGSVQGPVSVMEWFINYYDAATEYGKKVGAIECVVNAGETMFIPAGWYHIVLNLDLAIAITQNFASPLNAVRIANWLQSRPADISGVKGDESKAFIANNFAKIVAEHRPDLVPVLYHGRVLRLDDVAPNIRRHALAKVAEQQEQLQQQQQRQAQNDYIGDSLDDLEEGSSEEEFIDSEDITLNPDGTVAQIIQYDSGHANAATDSSSAEDVILSPIQNQPATIRMDRHQPDSPDSDQVDEVVLTPPPLENEERVENEEQQKQAQYPVAKRQRPSEGSNAAVYENEGSTLTRKQKEEDEDGEEPTQKKTKLGLWAGLKTTGSQGESEGEKKSSFAFNFARKGDNDSG